MLEHPPPNLKKSVCTGGSRMLLPSLELVDCPLALKVVGRFMFFKVG